MSAEARCQANRGINAVGFSKLTKYCDSFRFLELFCVYFYWEGTINYLQNVLTINPNHVRIYFARLVICFRANQSIKKANSYKKSDLVGYFLQGLFYAYNCS